MLISNRRSIEFDLTPNELKRRKQAGALRCSFDTSGGRRSGRVPAYRRVRFRFPGGVVVQSGDAVAAPLGSRNRSQAACRLTPRIEATAP